jgi:hypothetical protein
MNDLICNKIFNDLIEEFDLKPENLKNIITQDAKRKEYFETSLTPEKNENI